MSWLIPYVGWLLAGVFFILWVWSLFRRDNTIQQSLAVYEAGFAYIVDVVGGGIRLERFIDLLLNGNSEALARDFPTWPAYRDRHLASGGWGAE